MSGRSHSFSGRRAAVAAVLVGASLSALGCGDTRNDDKGFRPPNTVVIGVILHGPKSATSPAELGGGPVTFKITNQSGKDVANVRLHTAPGAAGCVSAEAVSGHIPNGGTGTVSATLVDGTCELVAEGVGVKHIIVTGERPSGQNTLLLP